MKKIVEMLFPERQRQVKPLEHEERLKLWGTVPDTDNCLRAVEDLLRSNLEQEFMVAIDPQREDGARLRACEGLRVHWHALRQVEDERYQAKELLKAPAENR